MPPGGSFELAQKSRESPILSLIISSPVANRENSLAPMSQSSLAVSPVIKTELDKGERVLWTGQPDAARLMERALPGAAFGVFGLSFLLFWMWGTTNELRQKLSAGLTPDLLNIFFAALGLVGIGLTLILIIWPFLEHNRAPHTFYALTNRRALIIVEGVVENRVQTVKPAEFALERRDKTDGRGDLILKREVNSQPGRRYADTEIGFFGIENVAHVENLARKIKA